MEPRSEDSSASSSPDATSAAADPAPGGPVSGEPATEGAALREPALRAAARDEDSWGDAADPLGLKETAGLLRGTATLLRLHWLPLLAIAVASVAAHYLLAELAVVAGRAGAVPGFLALALVPLSGLVAMVGMLMVVRTRQAPRSRFWGMVAALGSVLVPYLVVYERAGDLRADLIAYTRAGVYEDLGSDAGFSRLPEIGSWLVLGIVVVALAVRGIGGRLARSGRWDPDGPRTGVLQIVVGYAEAVWVTLGAWVVAGVLSGAESWWSGRVAAQRIFEGWADLSDRIPALGAAGDWLGNAAVALAGGAIIGLVVPVSMLTIAVIVYGLQVADAVPHETVLRAMHHRRWHTLSRRVGDASLLLAWDRLSDPGSRFGSLLGGIVVVLRSAFAPVLAYCILYTLISQVDVVIWWIATTLLGYREEIVWIAWYDPLTDISQILTLVLTMALTAVFADRLLSRFGAASQLRIHPPVRAGRAR